MNILIVDDEKLIRKGLHLGIPWKRIGINGIFEASSGREALDIMEQEKIDMIITDIQMPEMTGLELILEIRKRSEQVIIIVLTGYDEFDYARECIKMGVQGFLLKPVEEDELIECIKKQMDQLKNKREKVEKELYMRRIMGTSEQMELEVCCRNLLKNENTGKMVEEIQRKFPYIKEKKMRVALVLPSTDTTKMEEREEFSILTIKNVLIGYLDAQSFGITLLDITGKIILILYEGEKSDDLENHIVILRKLVKEECNISLRIILGNPVEHFEELYRSYNDAFYLMKEDREKYKDFIIGNTRKMPIDMFREVYLELKHYLCEYIGDTEKLLRVFRAFSDATNSYNITDQYVRRCCFEIASLVYYHCTVETGEQCESKLEGLLTALLSASREEMYGITYQYIQNLLKDGEKDANDLITDVKRYINENLVEDLTVSGIAAHFYLSPNYFSRLFKRIAKEGCNEYIIRKRIEKAKHLLGTTNLKVGRIAYDVGYQDVNYFSLAFKKQTGVSPLQYRENH